ncbi:DUF1127 domain-containing protein [Elioraea sp. Yellowstone]|jgi:uncharacterized protein YjiS (DUF1127 family)|uniref:DUF1127 domain-containing protein n=1 Tax=Elioraea sp. Yellowstone TaxID=2592070 RepID=UPI00115233FA|nr:DUF1127 domain-containing protein [Elioraea sp. Yellowstone]TQF78242.1 DUF1127 domain-containing protein [Elioraea sp. Yellowstone]
MVTITLPAAGAAPTRPAALRRLLAAAAAWYAERRTIAALARLDAHLLRDIGLPDRAEMHVVRRMLRAD